LRLADSGLTLPDFRRKLAAWQIIVSTIGTDPFITIGTDPFMTPLIVSGRIGVLMDDGSQQEFGPGEVSLLPPGHDAWVVGNDPVVVIDISGMVEYAKPHAH
jgi:hypothetical protein